MGGILQRIVPILPPLLLMIHLLTASLLVLVYAQQAPEEITPVTATTSPSTTTATTQIQQVGGTIIDHDITTDTVWTSSGSPYTVISPITIHGNATLRIEPGTKVVFANGITITVKGAIIADGAETSRITFELINPKSGDNYIVFKLLNGAVELRYTTVNTPFLVLDGNPSPVSSAFTIYNLVTGKLVLDNSDVRHIVLRWTTNMLWGMNLTVRNTIIRGSLGTIGALGSIFPGMEAEGTIVNIENSIVLDDIGFKSYHSQSIIEIKNSVFTGYFYLEGKVVGNITDSIFIGNRMKIDPCTKEHEAIVLRNNMIISETVDLNPTACGYEPPDAVDATHNWWGDPSGPYNKNMNPEGKGSVIEAVHLGVTKLYPWLSDPPRELPQLTVSLYPRHAFVGMPMKISIKVPDEESPKLVVVDIAGLGRFTLANETELTINIGRDNYNPLNLKVIAITKDLRANIFVTKFYTLEKPKITPYLEFLNKTYLRDKIAIPTHNVIIVASVIVEFPAYRYSFVYNDAVRAVTSWLLNNTEIKLEVSKEGKSLSGNFIKEVVGADHYQLLYMYNLSDGVYNASVTAITPVGGYNTSTVFYVDTSPPTVKQIEVVKTEEYDQKLRVEYRVVVRADVEDQIGVYAEIYVDGQSQGLKIVKKGLNELDIWVKGAGRHNVTVVFMDELRHRTDPHTFIISVGVTPQTQPFTTTTPQPLTTSKTVETPPPTTSLKTAETPTTKEPYQLINTTTIIALLAIVIAILLIIVLLKRRRI